MCQEHEQRTEYYYEITGRQSLQLAYERKKINCEQLKGFLRELLRILEAAGEYLLNPEHFILEPEYILSSCQNRAAVSLLLSCL